MYITVIINVQTFIQHSSVKVSFTTYPIEQSPFREANNHSSSQEISL